MTGIAASAATGRAIGSGSPATASSTGRIRKWRRNIPAIPLAEFQRAAQYIAPDGRRASAAEASFLTLSHARGKGLWLALYQKAAGLRGARGTALTPSSPRTARRSIASACFCGARITSRRATIWSRFLFLRLFGLIYLSAFVSFGVQAHGTDRQPRHPATGANWSMTLGARIGPERFYLMPMLFWWNASDVVIQARVLGSAPRLSLLLVFNLLPRLSLLLLYLLYLSLLYGGQVFMTYQWDTFLLEAGFLALLLTFDRTAGHLAAALAAVSLHVHVGHGQAAERRSQLVEPVGAVISLSHPAAAHAAGLVCRASAAGRADIRYRRHILRRAGAAVPDLLSAPAALLCRVRHPAAAKLHPAHRQLQLVQSADHAAVPAAVR